MNTKSQIFIDNKLVKPIISGLNIFVRLVGAVLKLNHNLEKEFKTIAICKFKGMGSIVQAIPLIQCIKKRYPKAKLIFISTIGNKDILELIPEIDELVLLNDKNMSSIIKSYPNFLFKLVKLRIGVYIDLEIYSNFSSLNTTLSLARNRLGFYLRSSQYRMGIYTHMMYYNTQSPIKQTYLQMARLLGITVAKIENKALIEHSTDSNKGKYIVINPNASDLRIERRWDKDAFIALIKKFTEKFSDYGIILIGGPTEMEYVKEIETELKMDSVINLAGKTTIRGLIETLSQASLLVTNDTGPMHLAAVQNTPTVALFGPCSPQQYGMMPNVIPVYENIYCSPCVHEFSSPPCQGDNQCMKRIKVELVFEKCTLVLQGKMPELHKTKFNTLSFTKQNSTQALGKVTRRTTR